MDPGETVARAYNILGPPETYFIGRDGRIAAREFGPIAEDKVAHSNDDGRTSPATILHDPRRSAAVAAQRAFLPLARHLLLLAIAMATWTFLAGPARGPGPAAAATVRCRIGRPPLEGPRDV